MNSLKALLLAASICTPALAQISYTTDGAIISQNFDNTALATTWADNTNYAGWYAGFVNTGVFTSATVLTQANGAQNSTSNSLYMFRSNTVTTTEGALGSFNINAQTLNGGTYIGMQLSNATAVTLTSFTLGYTGEQWRESAGSPSSFVVSYSLDATSLSTGTWTTVSAATYTASLSGTSLVLDGNATANRTSISATVVDIILPGQTLWVRWYSANVTGIDQGIGIDDVTFSASSVSAVPEPSTYAMFAGVAGLIGAVAMRRRSKKSAA